MEACIVLDRNPSPVPVGAQGPVHGARGQRLATTGECWALMIVAAAELGLTPGYIAEARSVLDGHCVHPMVGAALSRESSAMNDLLRHDADLIAKGNEVVGRLLAQHGLSLA